MQRFNDWRDGEGAVILFALVLSAVVIFAMSSLLNMSLEQDNVKSDISSAAENVKDKPEPKTLRDMQEQDATIKGEPEEIVIEPYIPEDTEVEKNNVRIEPIEANGTEWAADSFRAAGVLYHDGIRYTWYSEHILPGDGLYELNSNGRSVSAEGYVIDQDGFIACASSDYPIGTELWSPLGYLKVYDYCPESGTIDIYTSW